MFEQPKLLDDTDHRSEGIKDGIVRGVEHVNDGDKGVNNCVQGAKSIPRRLCSIFILDFFKVLI
jgi:hypothetical protein